jgi:predicted metalloprotease
MRLDELRPTRYAEDRRGGTLGNIGVGFLGLVVIVFVAMLLGVDPREVLSAIGVGAPPQTQQSVAPPSTAPQATDPAFDFARRVVGSAEDVWAPLLKAKGVAFRPATLTVYDLATPTSCGEGVSLAGPFYCPEDARIYIDLSFLDALGDRFGAPGKFAQAYVIAHEYGHHIQTLLGTMDAHGGPTGLEKGAESNSVRMELQADCYAGVWANRANAKFAILQNGDAAEGLRAAAAVGDDTLEKRTQGTAVPDSFTHGTGAQRMRWFQRGLDSGDMERCDTFSASRL